VKITDEMVDAAIDKWFTDTPNWRENGKRVLAAMWRADMRAALTAALAAQPDRYAQGFEKAREMAANVAAAHTPPAIPKGRAKFMQDGAYESIKDEQRGETIAAEIIARTIRNMEMPDAD